FGKPALGMALMRMSSTAASSCKIGSKACGPSVQFAPITWTFLFFSCLAASVGRMSPCVVPSSEYVSCATMGKPENERMASTARPQRPELEAIRAERVRLDDLRTRFDVLLVHTKDCFGLRGVQLVEAPLRPHCFV